MNEIPLQPPYDGRRLCRALVAAGALARVIVFFHLGPFGNDNHIQVIKYIYEHHALPLSTFSDQAYHPPLYHILAACLMPWGVKAVQALSLVFSLGALWVGAWLLGRPGWLDERSKPWCLGLLALHPQLILYSLFISNDSLAMLLGLLCFAQLWRCRQTPRLKQYALLGVCLGLGLLTKVTFLAFALPLTLFVLAQALAGRERRPALASALACFLLPAIALGAYKYAANAVQLGHPFFCNLDMNRWNELQHPTWLGLSSLFDMNLFKLMRHPVIAPATVHSYPLLLYGTFWYGYIPESTLHGDMTRFRGMGSIIYLLALAPTLLIVAGAGRWVRAAWGALRGAGTGARPWLFEATVLLTLLLNFGLIVAAGHKYDMWSVFQGRLLFPSYLGVLILLGQGLILVRRAPILDRLARRLLALLLIGFVIYLAGEIVISYLDPVDPLRLYHMLFLVDMRAGQ